MKRRGFLQLAASTSLATCLPMSFSTTAQAANVNHFYVMVHAGGGWDPTSLCDPKGDLERTDGKGPVNRYAAADIKTVGNIRYSPYPPGLDDPGIFDHFFTKHGSRLLVINGIDTETNSHSAGTRFVWSGNIDLGYPSFAALAAAVTGPDLPMTYITNGGYDFTDSLVSPTRAAGSGVFQELSFPNNPAPSNQSNRYFDKNADVNVDVYAMIEEARNSRLQRLINNEGLPQRRAAMSQLLMARSGDNNLNTLVQKLPTQISSGLKGQAEIAAAAFASGLAVSANLTQGGFDTHGNHDNSHYPRLASLLDGVDHLMDEISRHGLEDNVTVVIGSDFGRTPYFNGGNGKDHWNVTSMMALGAGISGDRVMGGTDAHFSALKVNPQTLALDTSGITLTPKHIHLALRAIGDISHHALAQKYGIGGELLNLMA